MIIYVDVDNTICDTGSDCNYSISTPIKKNINKINELHDRGHRIIYWTGRGSGTGLDWFQLTLNQLNEWGCKYNELRMGKPVYDIFIDDKNLNVKDFPIIDDYIND
jgi:hypothetical protein